MTDARDNETYEVVTIGSQVWMAENLRYEVAGSKKNPDFPSDIYGRLYDGDSAQEACPEGWHLPTDQEWNEMEVVLGLSADEARLSGWRGLHASQLKSSTGWNRDENGNNRSGFNAYPSGFYYPADAATDGVGALDGLGESTGFWALGKGKEMWVRFIGAPRQGVNRMAAEGTDGFMNSCRCVKDKGND